MSSTSIFFMIIIIVFIFSQTFTPLVKKKKKTLCRKGILKNHKNLNMVTYFMSILLRANVKAYHQ